MTKLSRLLEDKTPFCDNIEKKSGKKMSDEEKKKLEKKFTNNKNEEIDEKVDVKAIIKEVIDTDWSKDNESQMKVVQLLKGIATSDEKASNDFMKAIDKFTSGLKVEDFE